jgi:hypothetical protein
MNAHPRGMNAKMPKLTSAIIGIMVQPEASG